MNFSLDAAVGSFRKPLGLTPPTCFLHIDAPGHHVAFFRDPRQRPSHLRTLPQLRGSAIRHRDPGKKEWYRKKVADCKLKSMPIICFKCRKGPGKDTENLLLALPAPALLRRLPRHLRLGLKLRQSVPAGPMCSRPSSCTSFETRLADAENKTRLAEAAAAAAQGKPASVRAELALANAERKQRLAESATAGYLRERLANTERKQDFAEAAAAAAQDKPSFVHAELKLARAQAPPAGRMPAGKPAPAKTPARRKPDSGAAVGTHGGAAHEPAGVSCAGRNDPRDAGGLATPTAFGGSHGRPQVMGGRRG